MDDLPYVTNSSISSGEQTAVRPGEQREISMQAAYLTAYTSIVKPSSIWVVPNYLTQRWLPFLPPSHFWLIVAARQASYRNDRRGWFRAYINQLVSEIGVSRPVFFRTIKPFLLPDPNDPNPPGAYLQRFLRPDHEQNETLTYVPAPKGAIPDRRYFTILTDDPLCPADVDHLHHWLTAHAPANPTPESMADFLRQILGDYALNDIRATHVCANILPDSDPSRDAHLLTVVDLIADIWGDLKPHTSVWRPAAEDLHRLITQPGRDHSYPHYFRQRWLPELGAGPAALVTYLRSFCYYNSQSGEVRNQATFVTGDLESVFQVGRKTISRWLAQASDFVAEVDARKQPNQLVRTTYAVAMSEPLHPDDEKRLAPGGITDKMRRSPIGVTDILNGGGNEQNETQPHNPKLGQLPAITPLKGGINEANGHKSEANGHKSGANVLKNGSNGRQNSASTSPNASPAADLSTGGRYTSNSPVMAGGDGQNETQPGGVTDKMRLGDGQNETHINNYNLNDNKYRYYLEKHFELDWAAETWGEAKGQLPFVVVVAPTLEDLLDKMPKPVVGRMRQVALKRKYAPDHALAWYLWAVNQSWCDEPVAYMLERIRENDVNPPEAYATLIKIPWAMWRVYAAYCYHDLPTPARAEQFQLWNKEYGQHCLSELPFGVGEGIAELLKQSAELSANGQANGQANGRVKTAAPGDEIAGQHWKATKGELELQMTRATFNTWLKDAQFVGVSQTEAGLVYRVSVRNGYAVEWLTSRLHDMILKTLAAIDNRPIAAIEFLTADE